MADEHKRVEAQLGITGSGMATDPERIAHLQNERARKRATVSNTNNEDGPYEVLVVAIDDKAITSATLLYDTQRNEARERLDMFEIEEGEAAQSQRYSANIDGQPLGTIVEFGIELCDDDGACTFDPEDYPEVSHRFIIGKLPSSPEVISLAPTEGPESGGTRVSILGNDFRPGLEVRFDGENAQTEYINQNQVLAITPPHVPESVDVSVTNPDSEIAILPRAFTYLESPRLLAIDPVSGPSSGDTLVTLRGTFLIEGTRAFFDSVPCRNFQILSTSEAL